MSGHLVYVMGPSGAGKDSLFTYARNALALEPVVFAHRYITRPAGRGENHIALSVAEFSGRSAHGLFALEWVSHETHYGVGIEIDAWLAQGCTVVVNGSRQHLREALARYPLAYLVHVDAAPHIRAARLGARERETAGQVAARLARHVPFQVPEGVRMTTIDNSGSLETAGQAFVSVLRSLARTASRVA